MKNGITLLGEPGKFTLKYGEKKLGTAVEQNGVFVLNFIPERTTADSDNILSLGPWEHRDDIDYTDDTVGVIRQTCQLMMASGELTHPMKQLGASRLLNAPLAFSLKLSNESLKWRFLTRVVSLELNLYLQHPIKKAASWSDTTNMPTDDGVWGADAPDETTWGEPPAERTTRLLAEAEQRVAEMEILDSGRLVGVEPVPAASDQESGELVLAPGEYVDVE
ncbi:unnamed protein product, partial [Closterium sp. NIES-54]